MTLTLRAFLEDAGLEDFESKLKEGGVERILDLKTLGDEELTALGLPQGARERMLATMETFKPEPNRGVVAPSTDDAADADDKAAMKAKLAAMLGAGPPMPGAWPHVDMHIVASILRSVRT